MAYAFNDDKGKYDLDENVLGGASNTLYDAELAITENAADIADLQNKLILSEVTKVQFAATENIVRITVTLPDRSQRHIWFKTNGIDFQKNEETPYWHGH